MPTTNPLHLLKSLPWHFWIAILIVGMALFSRFSNTAEYLYFITDQGRDAIKLQNIANGDLTLIGPTSGLAGFYLGPLWYYLGVPGYLISNGSPLGISQWYIALACLSIPLWYWLTQTLFPKSRSWQLASFALLALIPGSVAGSTFIWNPLISLPLMALALLSLIKARSSRWWLILAFLSLGLTLQSEFAYVIFLLPPLYLLIFWIRQKISVLDYVVAAIAVAVTFIPQIIFEVKHSFLMSKALLTGVTSSEGSIPLLTLWVRRPAQLLSATQELLIGRIPNAALLLAILLLLSVFGAYRAWRGNVHSWKIITIVTLLPYLGYMFWRGNYSNFFPYYLTPHFIPLVLLMCYGLWSLKDISLPAKIAIPNLRQISAHIATALLAVLFTISCMYINSTHLEPNNQAGLAVITKANSLSLRYQQQDQVAVATVSTTPVSSAVVTFTPNFTNDPYDFVMQWLARSSNVPIPRTQSTSETGLVYAIIEPDREIPEKRFLPWYQQIREGRTLIRKEMVGILRLETWAKIEVATSGALPIYQEPLY